MAPAVGLSTRISEEVVSILDLLSSLRKVVEGEINEVMRSKSPGIPKGALTQLKEIGSLLNSLTESKVRLDKSSKVIAESMTPEEELTAVRSYIRAMAPRARMTFLDGEVQWASRNS